MLPDNVGMAAGLTIGFSVGMGGFGVTILGFIADNFGIISHGVKIHTQNDHPLSACGKG